MKLNNDRSKINRNSNVMNEEVHAMPVPDHVLAHKRTKDSHHTGIQQAD